MNLDKSKVKAPRPKIGEGSLRVARLTKPHGLKGGVKIELYTDNPELRFFEGAVFHLQVPEDSEWFAKTLTLSVLRWYNGSPVAFFEELADRTAVESAVRAILWIDEQTVEEGAEENAWYDIELAGMTALVDGVKVGTVKEVQHMPAQDLLVIDTGENRVLVPFVEAIVPSVDQEKGEITITPPVGLFEEPGTE